MLAITIFAVIGAAAVLAQLIAHFLLDISHGPVEPSPLLHYTGAPVPRRPRQPEPMIPSGIEYAAEELAKRQRPEPSMGEWGGGYI